MTQLTVADLRDDIRELFLPDENKSGNDTMSVGAELEMIPFYAGSGTRVPAQAGSPGGAEFLSSVAKEFDWLEEDASPDPSCWNFPDGRMSFEPGGQLEFSSAVCSTASQLLDTMEKWTQRLSTLAAEMGIDLRTIGIDDSTPVSDVPLQLRKERYVAMTRYFDAVGPFGVQMMRQTASLQVNLDRGSNPVERWRLLNSLAPYLVAMFANSPRYERRDTGHRSYRAHVWRMLDPRRTGIPFDAQDPVSAYLNFALDAPVILTRDAKGYPTLRELLERDSVTKEVWDVHLTTLFPEIRPRDYFEIRSIDALRPSHLCAAIAFLCGIVYAEPSASAALKLLGEPDSSLLVRCGRDGLRDPGVYDMTMSLLELAQTGCEVLGGDYLSPSHLARASGFFTEYTEKHRSPADDIEPSSGPQLWV